MEPARIYQQLLSPDCRKSRIANAMNILNAFFLAAICLLTSLGITITGSMTVTESVMITGQASDTLKYDSQTGLVVDKNMALVVASCSSCHSTELIRQNRFTREDRKSTRLNSSTHAHLVCRLLLEKK